MPSSPRHLIARAAPALFVLLWSTGFIGAKYGMPYAAPLTFLAIRMAFAVAILAVIVAIWRPLWPNPAQTFHSVVTGILVHGCYLGGVFIAIAQGVPAGISALLPGLQPVLMATLASRWLGERVNIWQWGGLALGLVGIFLVLNDRAIFGAGSLFGWTASFVSLFGITLGTLYQKRHGGAIDWRSGNLVQYAAALVFFASGALMFEDTHVEWTLPFVLALGHLVIVLSILTVALMYWLIRRSAATQVASLFYLVPATTAVLAWLLFDEKLNALAITGIVLCAGAVLIVNYRKS